MGDTSHLSIGEVLSLVQADFPDVTISKIRFLESQGLLDPERTPSGYRKFYEGDIDRLQWILTQQRDNFLPLKVIRERLDAWDETGDRPADEVGTPPPDGTSVGTTDASMGSAVGAPSLPPGPTHDPQPVPAPSLASEPSADPVPDSAADHRRQAASLAAGSALEVHPVAMAARAHEPDAATDPADIPEAPPAAESTPSSTSPPEDPTMDAPDTGAPAPGLHGHTAEEVAALAGVPLDVVTALEGFGMIASRRVGPGEYFDGSAVEVATACRPFIEAGVEVRHLRMYKIAAEREAGTLEQLVMPLLKQRNPEARARAVATVTELSQAGERLHGALLERLLSQTFG